MSLTPDERVGAALAAEQELKFLEQILAKLVNDDVESLGRVNTADEAYRHALRLQVIKDIRASYRAIINDGRLAQSERERQQT
ncbi:MAG: hypothetical protein AAFX52_11165 [Pseudomonadota bacterium]